MAQDVGPILEMVTEKYLLRSEAEWQGRQQAIGILDEVLGHLRAGDIARHRRLRPQRNFVGPDPDHHSVGRQSLHRNADRAARAPSSATTSGASGCSAACPAAAWASSSIPRRKAEAQERLQAIMSETKRRLEHAVPFAMEPVVYDFAINERGT